MIFNPKEKCTKTTHEYTFAVLKVDLQRFVQLPRRLSVRLTVRVLNTVRVSQEPPRYSSIAAFLDWAKTQHECSEIDPSRSQVATEHNEAKNENENMNNFALNCRTLSNCLIKTIHSPNPIRHSGKAAEENAAKALTTKKQYSYLLFMPEPKHKLEETPVQLEENMDVVWDNRFQFRLQVISPIDALSSMPLFVRRIRIADIQTNNKHRLQRSNHFRWGSLKVPIEALLSLPVIVNRFGHVLHVPHFPNAKKRRQLSGVTVFMNHIPMDTFLFNERQSLFGTAPTDE